MVDTVPKKLYTTEQQNIAAREDIIMGSKNVAGLNSRFDSTRNTGFKGAKGFNVYPRDGETSFNAADPAGVYTGTEVFLAETEVASISIEVTEIFDNTPTIIIGTAGDDDQFVTLADNVDLTALGTTTIAVPTTAQAMAATGNLIATIGGTPTQGACTITADVQV